MLNNNKKDGIKNNNNNKSSATAVPVAMKQTLGRQVGQEMMTPR